MYTVKRYKALKTINYTFINMCYMHVSQRRYCYKQRVIIYLFYMITSKGSRNKSDLPFYQTVLLVHHNLKPKDRYLVKVYSVI